MRPLGQLHKELQRQAERPRDGEDDRRQRAEALYLDTLEGSLELLPSDAELLGHVDLLVSDDLARLGELGVDCLYLTGSRVDPTLEGRVRGDAPTEDSRGIGRSLSGVRDLRESITHQEEGFFGAGCLELRGCEAHVVERLSLRGRRLARRVRQIGISLVVSLELAPDLVDTAAHRLKLASELAGGLGVHACHLFGLHDGAHVLLVLLTHQRQAADDKAGAGGHQHHAAVRRLGRRRPGGVLAFGSRSALVGGGGDFLDRRDGTHAVSRNNEAKGRHEIAHAVTKWWYDGESRECPRDAQTSGGVATESGASRCETSLTSQPRSALAAAAGCRRRRTTSTRIRPDCTIFSLVASDAMPRCTKRNTRPTPMRFEPLHEQVWRGALSATAKRSTRDGVLPGSPRRHRPPWFWIAGRGKAAASAERRTRWSSKRITSHQLAEIGMSLECVMSLGFALNSSSASRSVRTTTGAFMPPCATATGARRSTI